MGENGIFQKIERSRVLGKAIKTHDRIFYPVIQISIVKINENDIKGLEIVPVAFVVEEDSKKRVISLTDDEIDFEDIAELITEY
ncbi:MAG: hypothetical protein HZC47_06585 [Methanobacterium sp.]|uniref:hypothetical protein n=1 Tax=Methanobacterium sp. TaxID=2164 RepID=UPI003D649201|nr:hypothetical protein [Methanobacterium sp.]